MAPALFPSADGSANGRSLSPALSDRESFLDSDPYPTGRRPSQQAYTSSAPPQHAHNGASALPRTSSELFTRMEALLREKAEEIQLAGQLGATLLEQQAALEASMREISEAQHQFASTPAGRRSRVATGESAGGALAGAGESSDEGEREIGHETREKLAQLEEEMRQWDEGNSSLYEQVGIGAHRGVPSFTHLAAIANGQQDDDLFAGPRSTSHPAFGLGTGDPAAARRASEVPQPSGPLSSSMAPSSSATDAAAARRARNNQQHRNNDIELATEIGQSLLVEVRRLQALLSERDEQLAQHGRDREQLELELQASARELAEAKDSADKYRDEIWNLEVGSQELQSALGEAQSAAQRNEAERTRATKDLAHAREVIDQQRAEHEKMTASFEAFKAKHDTDMATMRKTTASLTREKGDLQTHLDGLKTELATRARGIKRIGSQQSGAIGLDELARGEGDSDEDDESGHRLGGIEDSVKASVRRKTGEGYPQHEHDLFGDSPENSPSARDTLPAADANDPSALRASLAHAQRTLATLRTQLSKEKQNSLQLRKQLGTNSAADTWDESSDGLSSRDNTPARVVSGGFRGRGSARGRGTAGRRRGSGAHGPSRLGREFAGDTSIDEDDDEQHQIEDDSFEQAGPGESGSLFEHHFPLQDEGDDSEATFDSPSQRQLNRMSAQSVDSLDPAFRQHQLAAGSDDEGSQISHESPFTRRTTMAEAFGSASPAQSNRPLSGMFGASRDPTLEQVHVQVQTADAATMTEWDGISLSEHETALAKARDEHSAVLAEVQQGHAKALTELSQGQSDELKHLGETHQTELAAALAAAAATAAVAHSDAVKKLTGDHQSATKSLRDEHDASVSELKTAHAAELEKATGELTSSHTAAVAQLQSEHTQAITHLRAEHASAIADFSGTHDAAVSKLRAEHETAQGELAAGHAKNIAQLKSEHGSEIEHIKAEGAATLAALTATHLAEQSKRESANQEQLDTVRTKHASALEALADSHRAKLAEATASREADTAAHESTVAQLKGEHDVMVAKLREEAASKAGSTTEAHAGELATVKEQHAKQLEDNSADFAAKLAAATAAHEARTVEHNTAIESINSQHQALISQLTADHASALECLKGEHTTALGDKDAAHATALRSLAAEHSTALESAKAEHAKALVDQQSTHDATLKRKADEADEAARRFEIERSNLLSSSDKDSAAALAQLNQEHAAVLARRDGEAKDALDKLRGEHAATITAKDDAHSAATDKLRDEHQAALTTAATSHEAALAALRVGHQAELARVLAGQGQTSEQHAAELAKREQDRRDELDRLAAEHQKAISEKDEAHSQAVALLETEHGAALAAKVSTHEKELSHLKDEHSSSAAKITAEGAAALAALTAAHAAATASSQGEFEAKAKALKSEHYAELSGLRKSHETALANQAAASASYLEAKTTALLSDRKGALTAQANAHENAMAGLIKTHSTRLAEQLAEHEANVARLQAAHTAQLASDRTGHEGALQNQKEAHLAAIADLTQLHKSAMAELIRKHELELDALRRSLSAKSAQLAATPRMEDKALANQTSLSDLTVITGLATPDATPVLSPGFQSTMTLRQQQQHRSGFDSDAATETETEGEFEDARETIGAPSPSPFKSASVRTGYQTADEPESGSEFDGHSRASSAAGNRINRIPVPLFTSPNKRGSINTFGRADTPDDHETDQSVETSAAAASAFLATRPISPDDEHAFRPESALSSFTQQTDDVTLPPQSATDKGKQPLMAPPPVPQSAARSPRKSGASTASRKSNQQLAPTRPTSPPPADLLYRAQSPAFDGAYEGRSGFLAPSAARTPGERRVRVQRSMASTTGDYTSHSYQDRSGTVKTKDGNSRRQSGASVSDLSVHSAISRRMSIASSGRTSDGGFDGPPLPQGGPGEQESPVIRAITQTMIGEFLWKYTRKPIGKGKSDKRHKRFFWLHPYTKTLYWSSADPGAASTTHSSAKSMFITGVRQIVDPNPNPPGLHQGSIIVKTPLREIHLTAPTRERHDTWFNAITYLLARPDVPDNSPTVRQRAASLSAGSPAAAGGTTPKARKSDGALFATTPKSRMYQQGVSQSESRLTPRGSTIGMGLVGRGPRLSSTPFGSVNKRQGTPAEEYERNAAFGSPRSLRTFSSSIGQDQDQGETSVEMIDRSEIPLELDDGDDEGFEGLENVRACCDGKHDVGSLSRRGHHHHHHQHHQHEHDADAAHSPTRRRSKSSLGPIGTWGSRRSTTPTPQPAKGQGVGSVGQPLAPLAMNSATSLGRKR